MLQFKIWLKGVSPMIWRRVQVTATSTTLVNPKSGKKTLVTTIRGALDSADVNNDGKVNCKDLRTVKAALGKKQGQVGFNPRADVNHDGVVDWQDVALIESQLARNRECNDRDDDDDHQRHD